jgi:hypothetical protein
MKNIMELSTMKGKKNEEDLDSYLMRELANMLQ